LQKAGEEQIKKIFHSGEKRKHTDSDSKRVVKRHKSD